MLTKEAIELLSEAESIITANEAIDNDTLAALPSDFQVHDLEKYLAVRRRLRGTMTTSVLADFADYVKANQEAGARVFINQGEMSATAVLNHGTPSEPGHADNTAKLVLQSTAAYKALCAIANGQALKQTQVAEFLEDWLGNIRCSREGADMGTARAIAAIRDISIEKLQRVASQEQQLAASRSAFESVKAEGTDIPTHIEFKAEPYVGLSERAFVLRLGILTGDKPSITLRVVKAEEHAEQMANELQGLVRNALAESLPVIVGSYSVKN